MVYVPSTTTPQYPPNKIAQPVPQQPAQPNQNIINRESEFLNTEAPTVVPSTSQDVTALLQPYLSTLSSLGPAYGAEMQYLAPYLQPSTAGPEAAMKMANAVPGNAGALSGMEAAWAKSPEEQSMTAAESALGNVVSSQTQPGFRDIAQGAQQFAGVTPYTDVLSAMLEGMKNYIVFGSVSPSLGNINVSNWPSNMQAAYNYLAQGLKPPTTPGQQGLPNPKVAAQTYQQQSQSGSNTQAGPTQSQ
jgi:hypothetical protein